MKRAWQILVMGGLVLALTAASGFAQGRGWCGQGRGRCWQNGGPGTGCWLTQVTPANPKEKAFAEQLAKLQTEIRDEQQALATLQKGGASPTAVSAQQTVLDNLRAQFREFMNKNSDLHQQMVNRYGGPGWCGGRGPGRWANCPLGMAAPACDLCPNCPWTK